MRKRADHEALPRVPHCGSASGAGGLGAGVGGQHRALGRRLQPRRRGTAATERGLDVPGGRGGAGRQRRRLRGAVPVAVSRSPVKLRNHLYKQQRGDARWLWFRISPKTGLTRSDKESLADRPLRPCRPIVPGGSEETASGLSLERRFQLCCRALLLYSQWFDMPTSILPAAFWAHMS